MERLGMVSRWYYDGIQRYGQYDRVPVQVLIRIRMGQRNLDLQGFR